MLHLLFRSKIEKVKRFDPYLTLGINVPCYSYVQLNILIGQMMGKQMLIIGNSLKITHECITAVVFPARHRIYAGPVLFTKADCQFVVKPFHLH